VAKRVAEAASNKIMCALKPELWLLQFSPYNNLFQSLLVRRLNRVRVRLTDILFLAWAEAANVIWRDKWYCSFVSDL